MSNQPNSQMDQLLREAMAAAKAGDKQTARSKLREIVGVDQNNERAWMLLATVTDDIEEKHICLGNVLVINPNNSRAKEMLDKLTASSATRVERSGSRGTTAAQLMTSMDPGIRRTVLIMAGLIVVGLVAVVILFRGGGGVPEPTPTVVVLGPGGETLTPTETPTPIQLPTLPPTWTPPPSETPRVSPTNTPLATPPSDIGLAGRLIAISGRALTLDNTLPLVLIDMQTFRITPITQSSDRGDFGIFLPDEARMIYARLVSGIRAQLILRIQNLNGTRPQELSQRWGNTPPLSDQRMPSVSANGRDLVFVAQNVTGENELYPGLYHLQLLDVLPPGVTPTATFTATSTASLIPSRTPEPSVTVVPTSTSTATYLPTPTPEPITVRRITQKDRGIFLYPSVSADGQRVLFTIDTEPIGQNGTDIYVLNYKEEGAQPVALTTDANAFIEAFPEWSPDGSQIVFQAKADGAEKNALFIMNADGSDRKALVENEADNVRPQWSPDGKFVAFSSDLPGKYEVYVIELATGQVYQVTTTRDSTIATDWGR